MGELLLKYTSVGHVYLISVLPVADVQHLPSQVLVKNIAEGILPFLVNHALGFYDV